MKATLTAVMILVSGYSLFAQDGYYGYYYQLLSSLNTSTNFLQLTSSTLSTVGAVASPVEISSSPADIETDTQIVLIGWSTANETDLNLLASMEANSPETWGSPVSSGVLEVGAPPVIIPDLGELQVIDMETIAGLQNVGLNDISTGFDVQSVPEPSVFALGGVGLAILGASRRRK